MMAAALHANWTAPFFALRGLQGQPAARYEAEDFELLTTLLSALEWRKNGGHIRMVTDAAGAGYYRSLGLEHIWDAGLVPFGRPPEEDGIDPFLFWAAGKIYALRQAGAPCVMLDTDFIVWKPIGRLLQGAQVAVIHREEISPEVYPPREVFQMAPDYAFPDWDWEQLPCNTALCYIAGEAFLRHYTASAIAFMRALRGGGDRVTGMVLAEQRLLSMCAAEKGVPITALTSLGALAEGQDSFTHIWGFKDALRSDRRQRDAFCTRCMRRLLRDFPGEEGALAAIGPLRRYYLAAKQ